MFLKLFLTANDTDYLKKNFRQQKSNFYSRLKSYTRTTLIWFFLIRILTRHAYIPGLDQL
jgi:hypothetical protein